MKWPMVKLGDIFKITSGGTPSRAKSEYYEHGNIAWIKTGDLHNKVVTFASEFITEAGLKNSSARMYPKNTILLAMYGATIGACSILKIEACTNQACAAFTPNSKVDTLFLYYLLKYNQPTFIAAGAGGAQPNISVTYLKNFSIPLPPLNEQKRIAAILDKADAIRHKRQQAISLADDFLRSIFLDMFILAADNWAVKTIEHIADKEKGGLRTGPFGSHLLHSEFVDAGIPVLGIDNVVENHFQWGKARFITEGKYKSLSRYTVHPGDVLITIMGTCGRCAVVPDDIPTAINTKHLCCISLDYKKALPEFLHSYYLFHPMSRQYLAKVTKGAIMDGLNMGLIKTMPFPMVPINLQEKYVEIKMAVLSKLDKQHLSESYQESLFNSLNQQLFAGKCLTA